MLISGLTNLEGLAVFLTALFWYLVSLAHRKNIVHLAYSADYIT